MHITHSVSLLSGDTVLTFRAGNFSKYVIHLETCRARMEVNNFVNNFSTNRVLLSLYPVTLSVLLTSHCCFFRSLMGQSPLLHKGHLLETGHSLVWSLVGQSLLLCKAHLLETTRSLMLIALSCNPKLSPAGQQTVKHDGLFPLLSIC